MVKSGNQLAGNSGTNAGGKQDSSDYDLDTGKDTARFVTAIENGSGDIGAIVTTTSPLEDCAFRGYPFADERRLRGR
jgi:hypothetical protein